MPGHVAVRVVGLIASLMAVVPAATADGPVDTEWGGHVKLRGSASWAETGSVRELLGGGRWEDGSAELRLLNRTELGRWGVFEVHYESVASAGDTVAARRAAESFGALLPGSMLPGGYPTDDRRALDLASPVRDGSRTDVGHRLDRLSLTLLPSWGTVTVGRRALTWGHGLVFNPLDLFNPYAPTDVERDYKVGDDMIDVELPLGGMAGLELLWVPRREPSSGDLEADRSSFAGKLHLVSGTTEVDLVAARHYGDEVLGVGLVGYAGSAAWRLDVTAIRTEDATVLAAAANMDRSWTWWDRNVYGFVEAFYTGFGTDRYREPDAELLERLDRGELYTLGRTYLAGHLNVEIHPLFNAYATAIVNAADPSAVLQPRVVWSLGQDLELTAGADWAVGGAGTEMGGFDVPGAGLRVAPSDRVYVWLSRYF